jgi:hypothetical protein
LTHNSLQKQAGQGATGISIAECLIFLVYWNCALFISLASELLNQQSELREE